MYGPLPVLFSFPLPEGITLSRNIRLSYFLFYLFDCQSVCFGDGILGWETFRRIAADPRIDEIPLILETTDPERWPEETRFLREAAGTPA